MRIREAAEGDNVVPFRGTRFYMEELVKLASRHNGDISTSYSPAAGAWIVNFNVAGNPKIHTEVAYNLNEAILKMYKAIVQGAG